MLGMLFNEQTSCLTAGNSGAQTIVEFAGLVNLTRLMCVQ